MKEELLNHLRSCWPGEDNTGFTPFDLIYKYGSAIEAVLYSELFWPSFTEVDGVVLLSSVVEDSEDRSRVRACLSAGGPRDVEENFNILDLGELFSRRSGGAAKPSHLAELGIRLQEMWSNCLDRTFPGRDFRVVLLPEANDGSEGVSIYFFEERT